MEEDALDQVFVDRKDQDLATHRLRFSPDGTVYSDWFERGQESGKGKSNVGRYTRTGAQVRVSWPSRSTSIRQRILNFLAPGRAAAVLDYRLIDFDNWVFLVREHSIADFAKWSADPDSDRERLPPNAYMPL